MNAGDIVGERYRIASHIGKGGMQDVYLAQDQLLGSKVALKTPLPGQREKRFTESAVLSARINHHNVAKTLDYLEDGGQVFMIEEFVPGDTLEKRLSFFKILDPHLAFRVLRHIVHGISASHNAGVVHRDLKPNNIMVEDGWNLHKLKVTDFGIATLMESVLEDASRAGDLTQSASATIRGALPYMAPEMMFRRSGDKIYPSADIWSIGAMMFRLTTGEFPFGLFLDAAVNVKNKERKAWPAFMTENLQYRTIALELQAVVDRCLSYDPSVRPSADELVRSLSDVCYINFPRSHGTITNFIHNGYSGFARGADGDIFFSMESVYGNRRPDGAGNRNICYSRFPGAPKYRGHPIVVVG